MTPTSKQIEEAKQTLTNAGYFTDNLWHVSDVKENFKQTFFDEVSDDTAQMILEYALTNPSTMEHIWEAIRIAAIDENLTMRNS
jgi:hypothetical protein